MTRWARVYATGNVIALSSTRMARGRRLRQSAEILRVAWTTLYAKAIHRPVSRPYGHTTGMSDVAIWLDRNLKVRQATRCARHRRSLSFFLRAPIARFPRGRRSGRALTLRARHESAGPVLVFLSPPPRAAAGLAAAARPACPRRSSARMRAAQGRDGSKAGLGRWGLGSASYGKGNLIWCP